MGHLHVVKPNVVQRSRSLVGALHKNSVTAPDHVSVELRDVDVLQDNVVTVQSHALAHDDSALADTTDSLVALDVQALESSVVVRQGHFRAVGATTRVVHATGLDNHILTLEAVVLGHALARVVRAASNLSSRSLRATEVERLVKNNHKRLRVIQVGDQLVGRGRVHDAAVASTDGS
ncbi:uncharacterized protein KRP23_445 [Phytophthora ramorum]|uniref:uncharacterized protein n=1 Tax=Phytophthora ramorum TaxID=164328 RepID=UPI0030AE91B2|nr:hypothetical protein KRP23_445 [Phytophthora ramorum]KAH7503605.1 hypothetical protein KRP22_6656 [Phytophthora ramorum]